MAISSLKIINGKCALFFEVLEWKNEIATACWKLYIAFLLFTCRLSAKAKSLPIIVSEVSFCLQTLRIWLCVHCIKRRATYILNIITWLVKYSLLCSYPNKVSICTNKFVISMIKVYNNMNLLQKYSRIFFGIDQN